MKTPLLILFLLLSPIAYAEYGSLRVFDNDTIATLDVAEGECLKILSAFQNPEPFSDADSGSYGAGATIVIIMNGEEAINKTLDEFDTTIVFVGPLTLQLKTEYSGMSVINYEIDDGNKTASSNVITLPVISSGTWEVLMETSTDLKNWTTATPGTFGANDNLQFFRLRVTRDE